MKLTTIDGPCRQLTNFVCVVFIAVTVQLLSADSCQFSLHTRRHSQHDLIKEQMKSKKPLDSRISHFSRYLKDKYSRSISSEDLHFLFGKWDEFQMSFHTHQGGRYASPPKMCKSRDIIRGFPPISLFRDSSNTSSPSLAELRTIISQRKETVLISSIKAHRHSKLKNKKENRHRIFSKIEAERAYNVSSTFTDPEKGACQLYRRSFCFKTYLSIHEKGHNIISFHPPSVSVSRCSQEQCQCLHESHECLPNGTRYSYHYMIGMDSHNLAWTWAFMIKDHKDCHCKSRCEKRRCIAPFILKKFDGGRTCGCSCPARKEHRCSDILLGKTKFSKSDYSCLMSGECLRPKCLLGDLTEEFLYHRMCPSRN